MNNNDSVGSEIFIGGALVSVILFVVIFKALKQFFLELAQTMDAFGHMAGSFISMLWNVAQVTFLISTTLASLACALYFTIRYFQMVRDGVALREDMETELKVLRSETTDLIEDLARELRRDIRIVDKRLTAALAKATVDTKPEVSSPTISKVELGSEIAPAIQNPPADSTAQIDTKISITMSNPL